MIMEPKQELVVQKDTRKKKQQSVKTKIFLSGAKFRRARKRALAGKYTQPFPNYKYKTFQHKVRKLREDATDAEKEANREASMQPALLLEKGYHNLPTQQGIQIGKKRGNGKTFVGTKGRLTTRS